MKHEIKINSTFDMKLVTPNFLFQYRHKVYCVDRSLNFRPRWNIKKDEKTEVQDSKKKKKILWPNSQS